MDHEIEWVRDAGSLATLLVRIDAGPIALDVEGDSLHHYPEKVCLLQISVAGHDYLLDPLAGMDLDGLGSVLADPSVTKILHGADYDLRVLDRDFGFRVNGLLDTMIAARLVGERSFGLAALLEKHFGVALDKRFQRADWSKRPLSAAMEAYAAMDTRYLARLAELLGVRLDESGRSAWAGEEYERLSAVRFNENDDPEAFRRVKGSAELPRRGLAILRELFAMREREARRRDRPPFRVLQNETLLGLSRKAPRAVSELDRVPVAWRGGKAATMLLQAIRRGLDCPEGELPDPRRKRRKRDPEGVGNRWPRLRDERDAVARQLDLEPSVLATRTALEDALRRVLEGLDPADTPELRRWQLGLLLPALERVARA